MLRKALFLLLAMAMLSPWLNPIIALLVGFAFTFFWGHPFEAYNKKLISWLLKVAVIGLGFGIDANEAINSGKTGLLFAFFTIVGTLVIGALIRKFFNLNSKESYLISSGTAICGGSAIAAIAPIIKASEKDISLAIGTVFLLNSIALILFPIIGYALNMSQAEFGIWSAIAIHDTSSVVGASSTYGAEALKIATTVKLTRALWIIPLAVFTSIIFKGKNKIKYPFFIGFFVIAVVLNTYLQIPEGIGESLIYAARKAMNLTLFLVGAGISIPQIKAAGWKSLVFGASLWILISITSLLVVINIQL